MPLIPDDFSIPIPRSQYAFSEPVTIKSWNGGSIVAKVGYVREHPEKNKIRLEKSWTSRGGQIQVQEYNIKKGDWADVKTVVERLLPEIGETPSEMDIESAVKKIGQDAQLLEVISKYPDFLSRLPENIDILSLPDDKKAALFQFLDSGGEVANSVIAKLSAQPLKDLEEFAKLLDDLKLSTINSLVTHVTGRINFISMFEKVVHNNASYERRGKDSVHNLLRANIWLLDRNYTVLHNDETLKSIIHARWNEEINDDEAGQRPDFLCMTDRMGQEEGYSNLVIIEIKRPSVEIKLEHIRQVMKYKEILQKHSGVSNPKFKCYIIGREIENSLLANPLSDSGFITKTYTDFIGDARKFYHDYLETIKEETYAF